MRELSLEVCLTVFVWAVLVWQLSVFAFLRAELDYCLCTSPSCGRAVKLWFHPVSWA